MVMVALPCGRTGDPTADTTRSRLARTAIGSSVVSTAWSGSLPSLASNVLWTSTRITVSSVTRLAVSVMALSLFPLTRSGGVMGIGFPAASISPYVAPAWLSEMLTTTRLP
jgi:hypothetical protein